MICGKLRITAKALVSALIISFAASASSSYAGQEELLNVIRRITDENIRAMATQPVVINAVETANHKEKKSLLNIMMLDKKWQSADAGDEWVNGFLNNPCSDYFRKVRQSSAEKGVSLYAEIFVTDKQGCIIAASGRTTDYWQGDEEKFIKSFAEGAGAVFTGRPDFDESSDKYVIQVSVPVMSPHTKRAIGVLTAGIDLDMLAEDILN